MFVIGPRVADDLEVGVSDLTRTGNQILAKAGAGSGSELFVRENERCLRENSDW